jgi:hypothetical protein
MELIHLFVARVADSHGRAYTACVYGERPEHNLWYGWLAFFPVDGGRALATDNEISQPDRRALEYWAGGLQPTYLDGALGRAFTRQPEQVLARLRERIDTDAALARAEPGYFARAATEARHRAEETERIRRAAEKQLSRR